MQIEYLESQNLWLTVSLCIGMVTVTLQLCVIAAQRLQGNILSAPLIASMLVPGLLWMGKLVLSPALQNDELTWHRLGVQSAAFLVGESFEPVAYVEGKEGYIWIVGALYALGGRSPATAVVFNLCLNALVCIVVMRITQVVANALGLEYVMAHRAMRVSGWAVALTPGTLLWTPAVLRETISVLCTVVILLAALQIKCGRLLLGHLILAGVAWWVIFQVRAEMAFMLLGAVVLALVWAVVSSSTYRLVLRTALIVALGIALLLYQSAVQALLTESSERFSATTMELSTIASTGFPGLSWNNSLAGILIVTGPRILLGPLPWDMTLSGGMLLAALEGAAWLTVLGLALWSMRSFQETDQSSRLMTVIMVFVACILLGLMLSVGNYGLLARFRPVATVCLLPMAAVCIAVLYQRRLNSSPTSKRLTQTRAIRPRYPARSIQEKGTGR